ncbi:hypothetical protein [Streptomyces sp. NPDC050704]|uniref:hypothetical protein n=1 Tax=Streptomyces sp. NPDC050704 TaxID=3157219 RepID=UPI00343E789A
MTKPRKQVYGQLMLFAALLLGIVAMHTLGHPSGHGAGHGQGPGHGSMAASEHRVTSAHAMSSTHSSERASAADPAQTTLVSAAGQTPMSGMDLSAVCLAVLGTFTFLVLVAVAFRRPSSPGAAPSDARPARALRPDPPPPGTLLARLSVLRI